MGVLVEFDALGKWGETHVCNCEIEPRLSRLGLAWGGRDGPSTPPTVTPLLKSDEDPRLLYLRAGSGFFGVLCEAGEWVASQEGAKASNNAGLDVSTGLPPALPSLEAFLETMLELTGNSIDEDD